MHSLPTVLAQSVLRCLPSKDIIALARCSSTLMRAAQDPFAWALSLLHIDSTHADAALSAQSRLLRHAPTFFLSTRKEYLPDGQDDLSDAEKIPTLPLLLHGLDVQEMSALYGDRRLRLLQHPSLRHLRSLKLWTSDVRGDVDEKTFAVITALPSLATLQLLIMRPGAGWLANIDSMPSLTSLSLCELALEPETMLPHLTRCARLRHLHLQVCASPALDGGQFGAFFSGPHMSRLQSLVLQGFHAGLHRKEYRESAVPLSAADFTAAFDAMQELHSLHLLNGSGHDLLLQSLPRARSLRELRLMPEEVNDITNEWMPPPALLAFVLDALPALHCELDLSLQCEDRGQILDFSPIARSMERFGERFNMSNVPEAEEGNEEDDEYEELE